MDENQNSPNEQWALARLGFAIDSFVDREINKPTVMANSGAYGIGDDGRMYTLGQPSQSATMQPRKPVNMTLVLLVLAAVYLVSKN